MKKIICIFLLLSLCVSFSACKSEKTYKNSNQMFIKNNSNERTNRLSRSDKEIFYGKWVITKHVARNKISTYGKQDIKRIIGKKLVYSVHLVSFDDATFKKPYYYKSVVRRNEFESSTNNFITFKDLGIKSESVTSVEVFKNNKIAWENPGSSFFVKNKDSLIMIDNGDFFELNRYQ